MSARLLCLCLAMVMFTGATCHGAEHVIVTGGPSLLRWETLRVPQDRHDRWWANFVRASTLRMVEIRRAYGREAKLVWIVYRPGYRTRGAEDGKPYLKWINDLAVKRNATLIWIDSGEQLISVLNGRPERAILTFDYFGHSNRHCFLIDYSNFIMGSSTAWLHENDLGRIRRSIFHRNAYCKSWGCHTGESMSRIWRQRLGVPLEGAAGKTDYTVVGHGYMPKIIGAWIR